MTAPGRFARVGELERIMYTEDATLGGLHPPPGRGEVSGENDPFVHARIGKEPIRSFDTSPGRREGWTD